MRLTTTEFLLFRDVEYDEPSLAPMDCAYAGRGDAGTQPDVVLPRRGQGRAEVRVGQGLPVGDDGYPAVVGVEVLADDPQPGSACRPARS